MRGSITRRGKRSWRLKYDVERIAGRRQTRYLTVRGTRREAEAELTRVLHEVATGTHVDPTDLTVEQWLHRWLDQQNVGEQTAETYRFAVARLVRSVGNIKLQKLRPAHIHEMKLTRADGKPLGVVTAKNTRRILKAALRTAVEIEIIHRNVASYGKPLAAEEGEVHILGPQDITTALEALRGSDLYALVNLALATGMRRGELLALRWIDVDGDLVRVERSLERMRRGGYRFKAPKTRAGRRAISIPRSTVEVLQEHRRHQLEIRMQLGMGKPDVGALVFCRYDGHHLVPTSVSHAWRRACGGRWKFHALRHTHASALIAAGLDLITISRRLGHSSAAVTLRVYGHLFGSKDGLAADAIGRVLGAKSVPNGANGH
jgi:integrase